MSVSGFKGFKKDLTCNGKQYAIGETATEPVAILCKKGIHFCEYPLDCFGYYSPAESRYCEVEAPDADVSDKTDSDSKRVTKRLKIGFELNFSALVAAAIKFTFDRATWSDTDKATGDQGAASSTGDQGAASSTGYRGAASSTGYRGAASSTGNRGAASSTGYRGAASSTGDQGAASSTGDQGAASSTGYRGAASSTGYRGAASSTGDQGAALVTGYASKATAGGQETIACALGEKSSAAGSLGNWLVLAERDDDGKILGVKTVKVDGKKIKADTFYVLTAGKIVEREGKPK